MHLLSICVVSYNHEKYIKECIESIWKNDYKDIEILVLDDGSSDSSVKILNELQKISPCPMSVFSQKNSGNIGSNYNKLLRLAKGKYVTLLSCDDKLIENSLNFKMQKMILDDNLAFICHSKIIYIDENSKIINTFSKLKLDKYKSPSIDDLLNLEYSELNAYLTQGAIYLKSIVDEIGGFDEDMICDDIVFRTKFERFVKNNPNYKFEVLHFPGFFYRRHESNISSNIKRQCKGVIQYLKRYWKNEKPPKELINWIKLAVKSKDDFIEIFSEFIEDEYKKEIFSSFINSSFPIKSIFFINYIIYKIKRIIKKCLLILFP